MIQLLKCLFFVMVSFAYASNQNYCQNLNPTHDFDEDTLLGLWYIHEYVFHKESDIYTKYSPYCPIIHIRKFEDYVQGGLITRRLVSVFIFVFIN